MTVTFKTDIKPLGRLLTATEYERLVAVLRTRAERFVRTLKLQDEMQKGIVNQTKLA